MEVFPNPFSYTTTLLIESEEETEANLAVFDARGQLVWEREKQQVKKGVTEIILRGRVFFYCNET